MRRSKMAAGLVLSALLGLATGCAPPVKTEEIQVINVDPMAQVKNTLNNYANGQPLGSEVTGYSAMVESVRKVSPEKADILEKGLADIQKPKANVRAIAKDLLAKL